jgi:hypothetical protein
MSERFEEKTNSAEIKNALDYIGLMAQECHQMGNNDSEFDLLNQLRVALEKGEIEPAVAKEQATAIRYGKIER